MEVDQITHKIIACAYDVHTALGPGLLESAYEECLCYELRKAGLSIKVQHALPLVYKEVRLEAGYRRDIWVEDKVVIEVKSVIALNDVHLAQTLTYLRLSKSPVGLLMNFNVARMRNGIRRVVSNYAPAH